MRSPFVLIAICTAFTSASAAEPRPAVPSNPAIDMPGYLAVAEEAARHRESHRVTEAEFIRMSRDPGTVVLDARSREKYDELHVKGALHLSFPDIAVESLARLLPDKNARILIYCNNNFLNEPRAFTSKVAVASLNIYTFNALHAYGYDNVYELGPLIDIRKSWIPFEGSQLSQWAAR
jgi:hypothetical protein